MTIRKNRADLYDATCDECGDIIVEDADSFFDALEGIKLRGSVSRAGTGWWHECDACFDNRKEDER
jgi:hypothetical protein